VNGESGLRVITGLADRPHWDTLNQGKYGVLSFETAKTTTKLTKTLHVLLKNAYTILAGKQVQTIKYIKTPTNALGFMDVMLLYNDHDMFRVNHVAIFRVLRTGIQM
jgi:hypothetical protein